MTKRVVVLASGGGTNCQALLDASFDGKLGADVVAVITNNPDAGVIERAERCDVEVAVIEHRGLDPAARRRADGNLIDAIDRFRPDLVVLAGWMRILGTEVGERFSLINLHPALPGELRGMGSIAKAYDESVAGTRSSSGVMVHWVPDGGVDVGPVIVSEEVPVKSTDTLESFERRMHAVEHRLIVDGTRRALREPTGP